MMENKETFDESWLIQLLMLIINLEYSLLESDLVDLNSL